MQAFIKKYIKQNHKMDMQAHSHIGTSNTSKILLQQKQIVPNALCVRMGIQQTNRAAILYRHNKGIT